MNQGRRSPAEAILAAERATVVAMENKFYEEFKVKGKTWWIRSTPLSTKATLGASF
jgi:hypothetical protein